MRSGKADDERIVFRKVSETMNRDERYLALSPVLPSGRSLWLHLLIGPHGTALPGLSHIGRLAMAEELGWSPEVFDEAFAEVFAQGLAKADWSSRVLWLPNALRHNPPQSPNVIRGWKRWWDRIPDCELKLEAYDTLKGGLKAYGEACLKAFGEACGKPSGKAFLKVSPKPFGEASVQARTSAKGKAFGEPSDKVSGEPSSEVSRKTIANQIDSRSPSEKYPSQVVESQGVVAVPRADTSVGAHTRGAPADVDAGDRDDDDHGTAALKVAR